MIKTSFGEQGENLACVFLEKLGYKIIERNFRIRGGEIDIVAIDNNTLVYIEVKTRSNRKFGFAEEAVTKQKLEFIKRTARFYKSSKKNLPESERIDVVAVDMSNFQDPKVKLIRNVTF